MEQTQWETYKRLTTRDATAAARLLSSTRWLASFILHRNLVDVKYKGNLQEAL